MKKLNIVFIALFTFFGFVVSAQINNTHRSISKDVQKVNNQLWLSNENLLTVQALGTPYWAISKIQLVSRGKGIEIAGNISMGVPNLDHFQRSKQGQQNN